MKACIDCGAPTPPAQERCAKCRKKIAPDYGPPVAVDARGNAAFVHKLKCWSENFDAITSGGKVCEVRAEEDRKFKAGDMLELLRTDRDGKATEPHTRLIVEVTHVERYAGPLELVGAGRPTDGSESIKPIPIAVLSLSRRGKLDVYEPPKVEPIGNAS